MKEIVEQEVRQKSRDPASICQKWKHNMTAITLQSGLQSVPSIHLEKIYDL